MPVNPDSARDSGYFIYLVTVELGLISLPLKERGKAITEVEVPSEFAFQAS
jgi:hypothetical protein